MNYILRASEMRAADKYAAETIGMDSFQLMLNASEALFLQAEDMLSFNKTKKILVFCGKGNNGGDGFAVTESLRNAGYKVKAYTVFGRDFSGDAKTAYERCSKDVIFDYNEEAHEEIKSSDLIIDCIFGTGFSGILPTDISRLINVINSSSALKLCCDIPSGCSCDDGKVLSIAVKADVTVTFAAYKPCFFLYPSKVYCGKTIVADIKIPDEAILQQKPNIEIITEELISAIMKKRPQNSHKGTFGGVQLVCGSKMMTGAVVLAAKGALRSGVGLVYIESGKYIRKILQSQLSEPVYVKKKRITKSTAYVVGCGLGKKAKRVKWVLKHEKPCVIDADSISYLAKHPNIMKKKHCESVLTPHPLEMARLLNTTVNEIESDRIKAAVKASSEFNSTVVLKGKHSIIATTDGKVYINITGNSGLAKGGSGDVLSGMIGSFMAQGYTPFQSTLIGVYLHGKASDLMKDSMSEFGMLPSDIPEAVGKLLRQYE